MSRDDLSDSFKMNGQPLIAGNYFMWSNEMEAVLRGNGLWKFVSTDTVESSNDGSSSGEIKRDLDLAYLLMFIDDTYKASIMKVGDP